MPSFLVLFCLSTIFVVQLLCFHVLLFVGPMISTPTIILFSVEWILVMFISIMATILNARNTPKPILLSQTPLPSTISDDNIQDRDTEAKIENGTALVERKPKREKKKTLEVNYEKHLGDFHCDPSMLCLSSSLQGAAHTALQSTKVHSNVDDV